VLGAITANNTLPPLFANSAVVVGAQNYAAGYLVRRLEMDWAAVLATRAAAGAPDGIVGYAITDRRARMTQEIEQMPIASFDPYSRADDPGQGGVSTIGSVVLGSAAFNTITVGWGQWAIEIPGEGDNSGLGTYTLESWDNLNWTQRDTEGNVTLLPRTFQLARQLCINCIIGIENFDSPTPWPAMGSDEEKGAWLDNIPDMEMLGIGQAIRQRAFLEDEIKN
jgi:hypothetical protein